MKKVPNYLVEHDQTKILTDKIQAKVKDIFADLVTNAKTLTNAGTFSALQSAIIEDVPSDVGVVRVAATYHLRTQLPALYKQQKQAGEVVPNEAPFSKETKGVIELTINIPLFGQIKAQARVHPSQNAVFPADLTINSEGSVGSLWYTDAVTILDKVKALNLLSAPQMNEVFEDW